MRRLFFVFIAVLLFVSCDNGGTKPELGTVTNVTVTTGGESLTISWDTLLDAESYTIIYTDDGTTPDSTASSISVTGNTYTHEDLDETKTYKYRVKPTADGYTSAYSDVTLGHLPDPIFTLTGNVSEYATEQFLVLLLEIDYNTATESPEDVTIIDSISLTPETNGDFTASFVFDRTKYIGYTYVIDMDESDDLSDNDVVLGSGDASVYTYSYFTSPVTYSFTKVKDWSTYGASHIYKAN